MGVSRIWVAILLIAAIGGVAAAQESDVVQESAVVQEQRIARGQALAETWCVRCHAIGAAGQASALSDAPSFATLAAQPGLSATRLAAVLVAPHPVMPEFPLTTRDLAALEAYMLSLTETQ